MLDIKCINLCRWAIKSLLVTIKYQLKKQFSPAANLLWTIPRCDSAAQNQVQAQVLKLLQQHQHVNDPVNHPVCRRSTPSQMKHCNFCNFTNVLKSAWTRTVGPTDERDSFTCGCSFIRRAHIQPVNESNAGITWHTPGYLHILEKSI